MFFSHTSRSLGASVRGVRSHGLSLFASFLVAWFSLAFLPVVCEKFIFIIIEVLLFFFSGCYLAYVVLFHSL